ncbi:MAG: ornithine carbamoyltransferase, partial [Lacipirellulaceae bacterium]
AMVDVIVVRAKAHATVEAVAEHSACSVINGLTDYSHPCQALADLFTMREQFGTLEGAKLTWVGDANNVARSLAFACAKLGVDFAVACPANYAFSPEETTELQTMFNSSDFSCTDDPQAAVAGASAVYTDVWASMGQEAEQEQRIKDFADYQVNEQLMSSAPNEAVFMHCLPAKRGQEVTDAVMDSPSSVIVEQAANRMHVQKGVLAWLLGVQG